MDLVGFKVIPPKTTLRLIYPDGAIGDTSLRMKSPKL
jgi:hypothetical protein